MSIGTDSQVVDALADGRNLERVLEALGCDTRKDIGVEFESPGGFIHCPMPDHPDRTPSVTVRASQGLLFCHSRCEVILPLDLIVEHGKAEDRAGAAKWVEELLGIKPVKLAAPIPIVDDPSLTVAQYLAMRGLPDWIAEKFDLQDVRCWAAGIDKGTKHVSYETGWYQTVLMPMRPGRRPRVRWNAPSSKLRWAPKVRFMDGRFEDYTRQEIPGQPAVEWPQDLIGMAQFASLTPGTWPPLLIVVEGESDVHALHAMGLTCVVGLPGTQTVKRLRAELLEAMLIANEGDTDLRSLTVLVWQEPGSAGAGFPKTVADVCSDIALESGFTAPTFAILHNAAIQGAPKDPASMLSDLPASMAAQRLQAGILAALPQATVAASIAAPPKVRPEGAQVALDVLQVDGLHTPPPAVTSIPVTTTPDDQDPVLPDELGPGWSAEAQVAALGSVPGPDSENTPPEAAVIYDVTGNPVVLGPQINSRASRVGEGAEWSAFDDLEDSPERDLAPASVEGFSSTFHRSIDGWTVEKIDKDGDVVYSTICSPFVLEQVERSSGEILVRVAAPFGGAWNRKRFELGATADAGRTCAQLASIGVLIANRQRPAVTDLLLCMARDRESSGQVVHVPSSTGWAGRPGTGHFGGIDVEPVNEFGARMFEANEIRRGLVADTVGAAREWWADAVNPLIAHPEGELHANHAAPLLALGAAAAAPLVGPLNEVGVDVAPVVWIAGLGGGGKSMTQKLAASIYAPSLPSLDGQAAFFANANISQAALSARVDSCRDLPLILDDVTQLPPPAGSTSRGDAARIEAAAALGMMIFNRKPIERATRDGGIRQTKPFRSTALFSAEVSMSSESSKAVITAGHRRRIATIEARPMFDRNLGAAYAERVNALSCKVGGAPGELLIQRIRELCSARQMRSQFEEIRRAVCALPEAAGVTQTQRESMTVNVLGFVLLAETSAGWERAAALDVALRMLQPYLAAGAGEGGATRDDELTGVEAALRSVEDLFAAHPHRFDHDGALDQPVPLQGYLGKKIRPQHDGSRRIVMLRGGMEMLQSRYGVTMQVIEQADAEGFCKQRHTARMSDGNRAKGVLWILPPAPHEGDEPDYDPSAPDPHNPDPYGLAPIREAFEQGAPVRVPGQIVVDEPTRESDEDATLLTVSHQVSKPELDRVLEYQNGDQNMEVRFAWTQGLYVIEDLNTAADPSLTAKIQQDVMEELAALRDMYQRSAEAVAAIDPDHPLAAPVQVLDLPAADDPNWSKIDALGPERARMQWKLQAEAQYRANHALTAEDKQAAHQAQVKHNRIHLMARLRHPEWFIFNEAGDGFAGPAPEAAPLPAPTA